MNPLFGYACYDYGMTFPSVIPGQTRWAGKEKHHTGHGRRRKAEAIIKRKKAKAKK